MNENLKAALVFLGGAAVGAAASFTITKKILEKKYENELVEELEKTRAYYSNRDKPIIVNHPNTFATPEDAVNALLEPYKGSDDPRPTVEEVLAEVRNADKNVFDDEPGPDEYLKDDSEYGIPDFVYEDEVKKRSPLLPYVITDEEFNEGHPAHEQFSLTYYEGDKVLADDRDEPVEDIEGAVGRENLLKFGHGSNDSRIVYVRNEKRRIDFEIAQHDGAFADVIGLGDYNRKGRG